MEIRDLVKKVSPYLIIIFITIPTHGILLLMDGVYWDGWLIYELLLEHDLDTLINIFRDAGLLFFTSIHWTMGHFKDIIFAYHFFSFLCILFTALLIYRIGILSKRIDRASSLLISIISLIYPAFQVSFELVIFPYVLFYMLFCLALYICLFSTSKTGLTHIVFRLLSLLLFFISFSLNSLLVFYYFLILPLNVYNQNRKPYAVLNAIKPLIWKLDYLSLPPIYWLIKESVLPRAGLYSNYNLFSFSISSLILNLIAFLKNSVIFPFHSSILNLIQNPSLIIIVVITTVAILLIKESSSAGQKIKIFYQFSFGVILLFVGILPYILVGQSPDRTGWTTRHAILIGLPVAIMLVGLFSIPFRDKPFYYSTIGCFLLASLIITFIYSMATNYLDWQVRWIKDRSVMVNLAGTDDANNYSIYWIDDKFPRASSEEYRFYEYSTMFKYIWGEETRVGFDLQSGTSKLTHIQGNQQYYSNEYNLSHIDPYGCQATLIVKPGNTVPQKGSLIFRYFYLKIFDPRKLDDFLSQITEVNIEYFPDPQLAVNCNKNK